MKCATVLKSSVVDLTDIVGSSKGSMYSHRLAWRVVRLISQGLCVNYTESLVKVEFGSTVTQS